jgi:hypothetical protein
MSIDENITYLEFLGHTPPYKLFVTYKNPNSGEVLILKKN